MYRAMAGIEADPEHPGFKHAILYPRIGGNLKYTAGKCHSIYGDVGVKWEVQGKQITLTVQIPVNTTAEIRLDKAKAVLESDGLTFARKQTIWLPKREALHTISHLNSNHNAECERVMRIWKRKRNLREYRKRGDS